MAFLLSRNLFFSVTLNPLPTLNIVDKAIVVRTSIDSESETNLDTKIFSLYHKHTLA